jgi:tetratricopeptide (TPR) repeat protein
MRTWDELLGQAALKAGRADPALSFFKRALLQALDWSERAPFDEARARIGLGRALVRMGRSLEAIPELLQGIDDVVAEEGARCVELLGARRALAEALAARGEFTAAIPVYEELASHEESCFGPNHPLLGETLARQAECHLERREHLRAEALLRRARAILGLSGGRARLLARVELHLAAVLIRQGQAEEGLEAMPKDLAPLAEFHDTILVHSLRTVARAAASSDRLLIARVLYEGVATRLQKVLPPDHPQVAESLRDLGYIFLRLEEHRRAEGPLRIALEQFQGVRGWEDLAVAKLAHWLAISLIGQAKYDEALPLLQKALEIVGKISGQDSPGYAEMLQCIGNLHRSQGNLRWAERFLTHAYATLERTVGLVPRESARVVKDLARCLADQGRRKELTNLMRRVLLQISKTHGEGHPALKVYQDLMAAYSRVTPVAAAA